MILFGFITQKNVSQFCSTVWMLPYAKLWMFHSQTKPQQDESKEVTAVMKQMLCTATNENNVTALNVAQNTCILKRMITQFTTTEDCVIHSNKWNRRMKTIKCYKCYICYQHRVIMLYINSIHSQMLHIKTHGYNIILKLSVILYHGA